MPATLSPPAASTALRGLTLPKADASAAVGTDGVAGTRAPAAAARHRGPPTGRSAAIARELDQARERGPLQRLVIPPCPTLLMRLRDALDQPEPDLPEVAAIAANDVAMAATLIKRANSPRYAAGSLAVGTVGQAMNRLGLNETARAMTLFLTQRALPVDSPQLQRFWQRSTRRAVAMQFLASELPGLDEELAHTYGLFCHVGLPVLLQCVRGYAGTMVEADARIDRSPIATENANHKTDHAVVGALVARVWRLPANVVAAIRLHHDLSVVGAAAADLDPEVQTLVAAGLVAEHLMRRAEHLSPERDWEQHGARALDWLGLDEGLLESWEDALEARFDAA